jgi:acetate kinase
MKVLVANLGSTSFKYRLYETEPKALVAEGRFERIGRPEGDCPDYQTAIQRCLGAIQGPGRPLTGLFELGAVGFKAVLAGPQGGLRIVDEAVLRAMEEYSFLAPAHNPPYVAALRAFAEAAPQVPLAALFETAFFDAMPEAAVTYAVPYEWKQKWGVRRYGFHGASHRYAAERAASLCGRTNLRQVSCHLGGSSSLAVVRDGKGVDCSFGMSPQSGLPHNNRVGDIDVFAVLHVMKRQGWSVDETARRLAEDSGLAGISGMSGDVRDLQKVASVEAQARLALDVLIYGIRRYLGAFMLDLGGLDVLSFSGGIGENSPEVRQAVCRDLGAFGILLDPERNSVAAGETEISADASTVRVWVIPADEEWIVARSAAELVAGMKAGPTA